MTSGGDWNACLHACKLGRLPLPSVYVVPFDISTTPDPRSVRAKQVGMGCWVAGNAAS